MEVLRRRFDGQRVRFRELLLDQAQVGKLTAQETRGHTEGAKPVRHQRRHHKT